MDVFPGSLPMPEDGEASGFSVGEVAGTALLLAPAALPALVYDAGSGGLFLDLGTGGDGAIPLATIVGVPLPDSPAADGL